MDINNHLVSVIIPCYNSENYILQCLNSVIHQTYKNLEVIVVDDFSSDRTIDVISGLKDSRIRIIRHKQNLGVGAARNTAINQANGRFIAFLDADDYWDAFKLEKQINFMVENNVTFSYTPYYRFDSFSNRLTHLVPAKDRLDLNEMLKNNYIGCLTVVYDQSALGKVFMPKMRKRQDWACWLNILRLTDFAYCYNEPLSFYRVGNSSLSKSKVKLLQHNFNFYRNHIGFAWLKSAFFMIRFLVYYFLFQREVKSLVNERI